MPEGRDTEMHAFSAYDLEMHAFSAYDLRWCMPEGSDTEGQLEKISSCHTLKVYGRRQ